jgi:hypothetical protein
MKTHDKRTEAGKIREAERKRRWAQAHPEYRRAYMAKWSAEHPGYFREKIKAWQAANRDRMREYRRAFRERKRVAAVNGWICDLAAAVAEATA